MPPVVTSFAGIPLLDIAFPRVTRNSYTALRCYHFAHGLADELSALMQPGSNSRRSKPTLHEAANLLSGALYTLAERNPPPPPHRLGGIETTLLRVSLMIGSTNRGDWWSDVAVSPSPGEIEVQDLWRDFALVDNYSRLAAFHDGSSSPGLVALATQSLQAFASAGGGGLFRTSFHPARTARPFYHGSGAVVDKTIVLMSTLAALEPWPAERAMRFLRDRLSDGPKPSAELRRQADEERISRSALDAARAALTIVSEPLSSSGGRATRWRLHDNSPPRLKTSERADALLRSRLSNGRSVPIKELRAAALPLGVSPRELRASGERLGAVLERVPGRSSSAHRWHLRDEPAPSLSVLEQACQLLDEMLPEGQSVAAAAIADEFTRRGYSLATLGRARRKMDVAWEQTPGGAWKEHTWHRGKTAVRIGETPE
jgi:hypothetical protein